MKKAVIMTHPISVHDQIGFLKFARVTAWSAWPAPEVKKTAAFRERRLHGRCRAAKMLKLGKKENAFISSIRSRSGAHFFWFQD
jgi:hypothetical protein